MKKICSYAAVLLVSLVCLQACGGGSAGVVPLEQAQPQKTAVISFATVTSDPSKQLRGVVLEAVLPVGLTVATDPVPLVTDPDAFNISSSALKGEANQQTFGTYNIVTKKVKITVVTFATDIAIGTFATLTCKVDSGNTLSASQFTSAIIPNNSSAFQATDQNGVDLTSTVTPKISATFGY